MVFWAPNLESYNDTAGYAGVWYTPRGMFKPNCPGANSNLSGAPLLTGGNEEFPKNTAYSRNPQLPFKIPHIPTNRDRKALNRGTSISSGAALN